MSIIIVIFTNIIGRYYVSIILNLFKFCYSILLYKNIPTIDIITATDIRYVISFMRVELKKFNAENYD